MLLLRVDKLRNKGISTLFRGIKWNKYKGPSSDEKNLVVGIRKELFINVIYMLYIYKFYI